MLFFTAKILIIVLVVIGVSYTFNKALRDIEKEGFSLASVDFRWMIGAGLAYLVGIAPSWLFWHRTMHALGQSPTLWESFRAYYMSHLGKYVPGKAMVVLIRTGAVRSERTDTTVAALCVFVETLTMMAVAAFVGGATLCFFYRDKPVLLLLAAGLMIAAGAPTIPPVFRKIIRVLRINRLKPDIDTALEGLSYRHMLTGWITIALGWLLIGFSMWLSLGALPDGPPPIADFPLLLACLSLSLVAGFVSFIPAGVGVREVITSELLERGLGYAPLTAFASAIVLRLSWLMSEIVILVILYVVWRVGRGPAPSTQPVKSQS